MEISKINIRYLAKPFVRAKVRIELDNCFAINNAELIFSNKDNKVHLVMPHITNMQNGENIELISIIDRNYFFYIENQVLNLFYNNQNQFINNVSPKQYQISNIKVISTIYKWCNRH